MKRALLSSTVVLALVLAACGNDPPMSDRAATELHDQVTAVRAAVDARDADGASRALDALHTSVARLRRSGDLTATRAATILRAAASVRAELVAITTTTTTTTTPTTAPPPPPPAAAADKGRGPGDGNDGKGKGKGNEKGDKKGDG